MASPPVEARSQISARREADDELQRLRGERETALLEPEELLMLDETPAGEMARHRPASRARVRGLGEL